MEINSRGSVASSNLWRSTVDFQELLVSLTFVHLFPMSILGIRLASRHYIEKAQGEIMLIVERH
jgi:hypothetical protein